MTEKNKIYKAADFERYYDGTMPADEMHELEKAALEDPFLADALEGYANTTSFESDIIELKEKLEKRRKKKVFSISSIGQSGWWRIAALFIIITGAGYFFYRLNYKSKENSIAGNEIKLSPLKKDSVSVNNDTVTTTSDVAFENHQLSNNKKEKKNALPSIKSLVGKETFPGDKNKIMPSLSVAERSNQGYSDSIKFNMKVDKNDKLPFSQYSLKGKVTDEKGNALAFATIKSKNRNETAVTDTSGHFLLASPDSNTKAVVSVIGYQAKMVTLQKDKEPVIAMNKNESNLDEVVVTGYGQKKTSRSTGSKTEELNGSISGVEIKSLDTTVLSNNEKFDQYIKANIKPVYDESDTLLTGEVLLSFTVNKNGRPRNINVVKSSCKECETEAINLLENGPDWIIEKQKRKTVLIKF